MALIDLIDAQVDHPVCTVTIGGVAVGSVLKIDYSKSFDQNAGTCTVTLGAALAGAPNDSSLVRVNQGYGTYVVSAFTGYVDSYTYNIPNKTWELKLRDVLKRAEDTWLDDTGVTYTTAQAETAVTSLLALAGLSVTAGTTNFTIGDTHPTTFKLCSIIDAVQQIASLIGWKLWAGADGTVYFQYRKPRPNDSSVTWIYTYGSNILTRNYEVTDKDLRNKIITLGYNGIRSEVRADSPYASIDRLACYSSEIIDTQGMSDTMAAWMLSDLNTLTYIYTFECVGNPYVDIGRSVGIVDSDLGLNTSFFVFSLNSTMDGSTGQYRYKVTAVRWGPGSTPIWTPPPPPPPPPKPGTPPPGKGNLLYVTTSNGLACCKKAYGTDGTDGVPVWHNLSWDVVSGGASLISQNGVSLFNDGSIDWTTYTAIGDWIVSPDKTINGQVEGIIDATELTLSNSVFVSNKTFNKFRIKPGLSAAGAVNILYFNLDPFSVVGDHFTAGWAMTGDGLYRVTGLPNLPVWTSQLTLAQAVSLGAIAGSNRGLAWYFATSVRKAGFVAVIVTVACGYGESPFDSVYGQAQYTVYSLDYGLTWQVDANKWVYNPGLDMGNRPQYHIEASNHLDDTYYMGNDWDGSPTGDQVAKNFPGGTSFMMAPGYRATAFPDFSAGLLDTHSPPHNRAYIPYCDNAGNVYPDDKRQYFTWGYGVYGADSVYRYSTAFSPPGGSPTPEAIGDAGMADVKWLFSNMFNEDKAVAISGVGDSIFWFTSNLSGATTWVTKHDLQIDGRIFIPLYQFCVPVDSDLVYFTGRRPTGTGGIGAMPCFTPDFGTTWIDISNVGTPGALDVIMSLDVGAMDHSTIFVDYYNEDGEGHDLVGLGTGIDISHWQGTMDFSVAVAQGIEFVFMKASQGASYNDPNYATYWADALTAGLARGAYHYFENAVNPTTQANNFIAMMDGDYGELGPVVDCEDETNPLTAANLKTFLDRVETVTGWKCTIYTRTSWWDVYVGTQSWTPDYPLWIARWSNTPNPLPVGWTSWRWWQYTSSAVGSDFGAASDTIDLNRS